MKALLTQGQARHRLIQTCWAVVILICAQYLFAFFWAEFRHSTANIGTVHPFTWSADHNFSDLTDYYGKFGSIQSPTLKDEWPVWNYPPAAAAVYYALLHAGNAAVAFLAVVIGGLFSLLVYFCIAVQRLVPPSRVRTVAIAATVATVVLSYPFQYVYWRANIEGIAFLFFAWGLVFFCEGRNWAAATMWGLGMCLKPYPGLFLLLLLRRRQYKAAIFAAVLSAVIQIPAFHIFAPTLPEAYKVLHSGVELYARMYVHYFRPSEARFQHSLLDSMKALWAMFGHWQALTVPNGHAEKWVFRGYLLLAPLVAAGTAIAFWRKPFLNQTLAIICIVLLLAPVSADYTTIAMHLCWGLVLVWLLMDVTAGPLRVSGGALVALFVPFAILFAPQNWLSYYAGILHTVVLFAFLIAAARIPMPSTLFADLTPAPGIPTQVP